MISLIMGFLAAIRPIYAIFLLILISALSAPAFAFIMTVPDETINVPTGITRQIDIRIDSGGADEISFSLLDAKPWVTQDAQLMKIMPDETKHLSLFITPFLDTAPGVYRMSLLAESLTSGEQQKKFIFISVSKIDILEIDRIDVSGNFTPTGQANVKISLKNYKSNTLTNVKVTSSVSSPSGKLIEFDQNIDSIDSEETKNITYLLVLPRQAEPGVYTIAVMVASDGETREKTRSFSVVSEAKFTTDSGKRPLVFGFIKFITVTNIGNTKDDITVTDTLSPFDAAFYSGEKPVSMRNGRFVWLLRDIAPGETRTLEYKVDYTSLFLFVVVVLLAGWLFFFKIRTLRIKKFMLEKKFIEEGEEFTVGIELANATGRKIDDLHVKDFVPSVFSVKDGEGLKPAKKRTAAGTELTWKLKDLHKNEERILSYKILPVFGVHGTIRLPQASVLFKGRKREVEIRSAYTPIGIETENYGEKRSFFRRKKE